MAWTTPGTATAGEVLTAAFWNTQVRDNLSNLRALTNIVQTVKTDTQSIGVVGKVWTAVSGLSATITPTSSSSKILITVQLSIGSNGGTVMARLTGGNAGTFIGDAAGTRIRASSGTVPIEGSAISTIVLTYLDSPATTSPITYGVEMQERNGDDAYYVNRSHTDTASDAFGRQASSIIVQEIPA